MLRHGSSGSGGTEEHVPLRDRSHGEVQGNLGRRSPGPGYDADPPPQTPGFHPKVPQGTNHTDPQDGGSQGHLGQHDHTGRLRDQLPPVGSSALSDVRDAVQGPHICPRGANHVRLHQYNKSHPHDPLVHGPTGTATHHYTQSPLVRQNCPQIHPNRVPGLIPDQTVQPTAEPMLPLHAVRPHCHNVFGGKAQVQAVRGEPQHRGVPAEEGAAADHHGQVRQLPRATPRLQHKVPQEEGDSPGHCDHSHDPTPVRNLQTDPSSRPQEPSPRPNHPKSHQPRPYPKSHQQGSQTTNGCRTPTYPTNHAHTSAHNRPPVQDPQQPKQKDQEGTEGQGEAGGCPSSTGPADQEQNPKTHPNHTHHNHPSYTNRPRDGCPTITPISQLTDPKTQTSTLREPHGQSSDNSPQKTNGLPPQADPLDRRQEGANSPGRQHQGRIRHDSGPSHRGDVKIVSWNAQGLRHKLPGLIQIALEEDIHIIALQETNLTAPNNKPPIKIPGYVTFYSPRIPGQARGLITLVKSTIPASHLNHDPQVGNTTETLSTKIHLQSGPYIFHNVHRRRAQHPFHLTPLIELPLPSIVIGDFNAHNPRWGPPTPPVTTSGRNLAEELDLLNDYVCINHQVPTHERGSALDLAILHTSLAGIAEWSLHGTLHSDHSAIQVVLRTTVPDRPTTFIPKWRVERADWDKYRAKLTELALTDTQPHSLQEEADQIVDHVTQAANLAIPLTKPHNYRKDHWYSNDGLRESKRLANRALRTYRKLPSEANRENLKTRVKEFNDSARLAKHQSWKDWVTGLNSLTKPKALWQRIKRVRGVPHKPPTHPDPHGKAAELIQFFADRTATTNLPPETQLILAREQEGREGVINQAINERSPADTPFTEQELLLALRRPKDSSPGDDRITYSMLRHAPSPTHTLMLRLFNKSFAAGELPQSWKVATVVPIPKPGDPTAHRPISLLPCISKIMEVLVLNRLRHIARPLHSHTFGFKKKSGTIDSAATLIQDLTRHKRSGVLAVFLDIEKAFDMANPTAILTGLVKAGVRGRTLNWVKDFLTNRRAFLRYQGGLSHTADFHNGTPQGSTLSPTIFNYLVDQLHEVELPPGVKLLGYADDFVLYVPNSCHSHGRLVTALQRLSNMICNIGLKVSPTKTKALHFGTKTNLRNPNLLLGNTPLEWVDQFRYLGVVLDRKLTFNPHAKHLALKAQRRLDVMKVMASLTGVQAHILRQMYTATVRSTLEYGIQFLSGATKKTLNILTKVHLAAIRVIAGVPDGTGFDALQHELNLPPLETRAQIATAKLATRISRNPDHPLHGNMARWAELDPRVFESKTWGIRTARTLIQLAPGRTIPTPDPPTLPLPPWSKHPLITKVHHPHKSKKGVATDTLRETAETNLHAINCSADHIYYTDGSVTGNIATAAMCTEYYSRAIRLNNGTSILQAELAAISMALNHAHHQGPGQTVIHTDSLASIHVISSRTPNDNILLYNSILEAAQRLPTPPVINPFAAGPIQGV